MLTNLYDIREEWVSRAKSNKFHLFRKWHLRRLWDNNSDLRLQVITNFWKHGLLTTATYFELTGERYE